MSLPVCLLSNVADRHLCKDHQKLKKYLPCRNKRYPLGHFHELFMVRFLKVSTLEDIIYSTKDYKVSTPEKSIFLFFFGPRKPRTLPSSCDRGRRRRRRGSLRGGVEEEEDPRRSRWWCRCRRKLKKEDNDLILVEEVYCQDLDKVGWGA